MFENLMRMWIAGRASSAWHLPDRSEQPLRSELYSADQMEHHGEKLAESHRGAKPC
jgi:hypothetical protein